MITILVLVLTHAPPPQAPPIRVAQAPAIVHTFRATSSSTLSPAWPEGYTAAHRAAREGRRPLRLLLSSRTCRWCPEARRLLNASGVEYVYVDITVHRQFAYLARRGVPQLMVYTDGTLSRARRYVGLGAIRAWLRRCVADRGRPRQVSSDGNGRQDWSILGRWNPSYAETYAHLTNPAHPHQYTAEQLKGRSLACLLDIHDGDHNRIGPWQPGQAIPSFGARRVGTAAISVSRSYSSCPGGTCPTRKRWWRRL